MSDQTSEVLRRVETLGSLLKSRLVATNTTPQHLKNCAEARKALHELLGYFRTALKDNEALTRELQAWIKEFPRGRVMSPNLPGESCDGDPACEKCDECKAEVSREYANAISFVERDPTTGET